MLAMDVNADAGSLDEYSALRFFASKLAPTTCITSSWSSLHERFQHPRTDHRPAWLCHPVAQS
ncbi:hypothetical protein CEC48_25225 [Pseudomonas sp. K2I15]|nr:hypothetical protein CEC48_25225 [Pseudomonas sp. K2I15]